MATKDNDQTQPGLEDVLFTETGLSQIDGEAGQLIIQGFPVEELATNATYEETVYLLFNNRLPTADELSRFRKDLAGQRQIGRNVKAVLEQAAAENKPAMDALRMGAAAANLNVREEDPNEHAKRIIAVFPTIVATYWNYRKGKDPISPREDLGHAANYLYMLTGEEQPEAAVQGLETYLNTVVDHGVNASTFTGRIVVSTQSDLVSAATAAVGTLKGPLHGGAPGPVLEMLQKIDAGESPEEYVRNKLNSGERIMGFGHRVYKVPDPRAAVLSTAAENFYESKEDSDFFRTAQEFEEVAIDILAEHKPDRRLATNVEFYTAVLLRGVGIPKELFTATFGVSRAAGWMAHCLEQLEANTLIRPRSRYIGPKGRTWTSIENR